eukprot:560920-Rhodomonas_salina.1
MGNTSAAGREAHVESRAVSGCAMMEGRPAPGAGSRRCAETHDLRPRVLGPKGGERKMKGTARWEPRGMCWWLLSS